MIPYSNFARFYDKLMYDFNYQGILGKVAEKFDFKGKKGIELCTGTAEFLSMLIKKGADMTGVDLSCDMLNAARDKIKIKAQNALFIQDDINDFSLTKEYDFICSICDGFNYLTPKKIIGFLKETINHLKDEGILFFDISTKYKAENYLNNALHYEDREDISYFYQTKMNPKKQYVDMYLTIFEHLQDNVYKRYDDYNRQYYYDTDVILQSLTDAGYEVDTYDGDKITPFTEKSSRLLVIARKAKK